MEFRFSYDSDIQKIDAFELGDIELLIDNIIYDTNKYIPNQSVMLLVSISDLLGIVLNLKKKENRTYEFVGADSSFWISFKRNKNNDLIELKVKESKISHFVYLNTIETALNSACDVFIKKYHYLLDKSGSDYKDFIWSLNTFKKSIP